MNKMSLSLNVAENPTKHAKYIEVKTNIADTTLVKIEIRVLICSFIKTSMKLGQCCSMSLSGSLETSLRMTR